MAFLGKKTKFVLKVAVGLGLIAYVLHSRMVDFHSLHASLFSPTSLAVSLLFMLFSAGCCAARWQLLVRAQGLDLSFYELFELTMIGNFFNTFMPGAVGGDLIKAWYIAGRAPGRKGIAVLTVLLDRLIGLAVILFAAAATLLFCADWLNSHKALWALAYAVWTFTGGSLLFALIFFTPLRRFSGFRWLITRFHRVPKLHELLEAALLYRHHLVAMVLAITLSSLSIVSIILLYWWQGRGMAIPMELWGYFIVVPLATVASAVPILPGGLGTGQLAFFTLFGWMGMQLPEQGGALCTLMQIYIVLFNCTGAIFYLKFKRKVAYPLAAATSS